MALISALGEARRLLPRTQGTSAPVEVPGAEPLASKETQIPLLAGWVQASWLHQEAGVPCFGVWAHR